MIDLSPTTRALLDAARDGLSPDAAALRRVRDKVDAAVAGGAAAAGTSVAVKLAIVSALALVVGGAIALRGEAVVAAPPALTFSAPAAEVLHVERAHERVPPVHVEMAAPPAPRAARVVPAPSASVDAADVVEPPPPPPLPSPPPRGIDLAREVELVDAAMAALRRGDATAALGSVRQHRAETDNRGQLAEDAAAIEIEALCKLHDRRVVAKLDAFDARWPESAQRSRLSTNCF